MWRGVACLILAASVASAIETVHAADLGVYPAPVTEGVACESPAAQAFGSVWLGHFTGGVSYSLGPGQAIALDWRDETLCFPSRRSCGRYIGEMRRAFHHPEGYFTCLPIR